MFFKGDAVPLEGVVLKMPTTDRSTIPSVYLQLTCACCVDSHARMQVINRLTATNALQLELDVSMFFDLENIKRKSVFLSHIPVLQYRYLDGIQVTISLSVLLVSNIINL